ncbi:MAG: hypothetical protein LBJ00_10905 [Planctomycetaceae bacterium]|nr:hypothetical protein [Planctomycetaceae bacterium]
MKRLFKGEAYRPTGYGIILFQCDALKWFLYKFRFRYNLDLNLTVLCLSIFKTDCVGRLRHCAAMVV